MMIDTSKLVAAIDEALAGLETHKMLSDIATSLDPNFAPFAHQKGKNEGAREVLEALKLGIERGSFAVEPDTIPAPAPEPEKYGVFYTGSGKVVRSGYLPGTYATRSEAWSDVIDNAQSDAGLDSRYYEVQAL